jgi:hypothetical protein
MDTERDFLFVDERIATSFNPFSEGEYLVIQTYPRDKELRVDKRSFNYKSAETHCNLQNLAHDYTSFGVRIFHELKLWHVDFWGNPSEISKKQDWLITQAYLKAHYDRKTEEEIIVCSCSYPYFSSLKNRMGECGDIEYWRPVTCLVDDHGRDIECCPNCNSRLIEEDDLDEDFDDEEFTPVYCVGCSNYHGQYYGDNLLVCA